MRGEAWENSDALAQLRRDYSELRDEELEAEERWTAEQAAARRQERAKRARNPDSDAGPPSNS